MTNDLSAPPSASRQRIPMAALRNALDLTRLAIEDPALRALFSCATLSVHAVLEVIDELEESPEELEVPLV